MLYDQMDATVKGDYCIGVVIPARNEERFVQRVIETLPQYVDSIVVVNDGSTDDTQKILENLPSSKLHVLQLEGMGVGAAIDSGHQYLLEKWTSEKFISVVVAGDGQMNPNDMDGILEPILAQRADYVKGDRFSHPKGVQKMPRHRKIASRILSFATTLATGQVITDSQCGYTATESEVLRQWNWDTSWRGYGYPNYWLIQLSKLGFRIRHVTVESIYGDEISGIRRFPFLFRVGIMMALEHHRRNFSWLFSHRITPHTLFASIAYFIGWMALLPSMSTDFERELVGRGVAPIFITIAAWAIAHVFDRGAARTVQELRLNAKTRQKT